MLEGWFEHKCTMPKGDSNGSERVLMMISGRHLTYPNRREREEVAGALRCRECVLGTPSSEEAQAGTLWIAFGAA